MIATIHYDKQIQLDPSNLLKHVFINTTKNFTAFNIIQNIHNIAALTTCDSISYGINGSILVFSYHGQEWYNIFPFMKEININSINYQITTEGICYTAQVEENSGNSILKYIYSTNSFSEIRTIPNCILDISKVNTRSTRQVPEANEYQSSSFKMHFNILSSFYPIQAKDDIEDIKNNTDNTLLKYNLSQNFGYEHSNNTVNQDLDKVNKMTEYNAAHVELTNNIMINSKSAGSKLTPPFHNLISWIWQYFSPTPDKEVIQDISSNEDINLAQQIVDCTYSVINCNNSTTNIQNNLTLSDDRGKNTLKQVTNTWDIHNNLVLGQLLVHKFCGKNKLLHATNYISPEQRHDIALDQIEEEVLGMLGRFAYDHL